MSGQIFVIDNLLGDQDLLFALEAIKRSGGTNVGYHNDSETYIQEAVGKSVIEKGVTRAISESGLLTEATLPNNQPKSNLADTLRYMTAMLQVEQELLIIDPYLFPPSLQTHPDATYVPFAQTVLSSTLATINRLRIVTKANRDQSTESAFHAMAMSVNSTLNIQTKYTDDFHDRFWIGDGVRGLFIGTSLNGIGKRYSLIDYLEDADAAQIYNAYNLLP